MSKTFWDQQEKARARTGRLWFGFFVAVTGIVLAMYLPVVAIVRFSEISFTDFTWLWSFQRMALILFFLVLIVILVVCARGYGVFHPADLTSP